MQSGDTVWVIRNYVRQNDDEEKYGVSRGYVKHIYLNKRNELHIQVVSEGISNSFYCNGKSSGGYKASNVYPTQELAEEHLRKLLAGNR